MFICIPQCILHDSGLFVSLMNFMLYSHVHRSIPCWMLCFAWNEIDTGEHGIMFPSHVDVSLCVSLSPFLSLESIF